MAPLCADPRQIIIALNPARRQELLKLVQEIATCMVSRLDSLHNDLGNIKLEDGSEDGTDVDKTSDREGKHISDKVGNDKEPSAKKPLMDNTNKQAERVQMAALKHLIDWKNEFLSKLEEIVNVEDTSKIQAERQTRYDALEKKKMDHPEDEEALTDLGGVKVDKKEAISALQTLYRPVKTKLTTIPTQDRMEAISCILLLLLSTGKYSAHSRTLVLYLASALELPQTFLDGEEAEIAKSLIESSTADDSQKEAMSAEAEAAKRRQENKITRFWKVGLASIAGAAVIGVTGGLAAPLVAGALGGILGGVGLGGVASFLGIFWMNGALIGALFGAYGAKMTGEMMDNYAKEVEDFCFIPLEDDDDAKGAPDSKDEKKQEQQKQHQDRRLRVTIGVNGWLNSEEDVTKPWRVLGQDTEVFALRYEMKTLLALGSALEDLIHSFAWKAFKAEIIKRTVLATLWAALWPIQILSAASSVDNPFGRASNRSKKAGRILADALINKVQGERPVTLVGFSLGATAIHACLQSLAERNAFGLVDTVVIIGAPAPSDPAHWRTISTVVSGKIFNVYSENDMVLGFVYRMHSLALGVAGLQAIEGIEGVENLDLSERVSGHLRYATLTGEILRWCGFVAVTAGGEIEKDEVIMMKERHAQGDFVDSEEPLPEGQAHVEKNPTHELQEQGVMNGINKLDISSPVLSEPSHQKSPPLPRQPIPETVPSNSPQSDESNKHSHIQRRPVPSQHKSEESEATPAGASVNLESTLASEADDGDNKMIM